MKQHITFQQFGELSFENQKKLKDWVSSVFQKESENNNPGNFVTIDRLRVEDYCLSIGQMIEFLDEHWDNWEIHMFFHNYLTCNESCRNKKEYEIEDEDGNKFSSWQSPCDALWEEVKEVLENK